MKIDKEIIKYLNGEKFSNGYKFNLSKSTEERDRDSYILNSCKKKKVLHRLQATGRQLSILRGINVGTIGCNV